MGNDVLVSGAVQSRGGGALCDLDGRADHGEECEDGDERAIGGSSGVEGVNVV